MQEQRLAGAGMAHRERERERCAHAASQDVRLLRAGEIEQRFRFLDVQVPAERLDAAAGETGLAPVVGDRGEVPRERGEPVHLLPFALAALRRPARDHRAEAARREHQQVRPGALDEIVDPDSIDRRERHAGIIGKPAGVPLQRLA